MNRLQMALVMGYAILLSACGGGGGSSSGSDRTDVYTGSELISFQSPAQAQSLSLDINISIAGDQVTIDDSNGSQFVGELDDEELTASGVIVGGRVAGNLFCEDVTMEYKGSLNGENILGTVAGEVVCTGITGTALYTVVGSFRASLSDA